MWKQLQAQHNQYPWLLFVANLVSGLVQHWVSYSHTPPGNCAGADAVVVEVVNQSPVADSMRIHGQSPGLLEMDRQLDLLHHWLAHQLYHFAAFPEPMRQSQ